MLMFYERFYEWFLRPCSMPSVPKYIINKMVHIYCMLLLLFRIKKYSFITNALQILINKTLRVPIMSDKILLESGIGEMI